MNQAEEAIQTAKRKVMAYGYTDTERVSDRDIMLFGFGYMSDRFNNNTVHVQLVGKIPMGAATLVGAAIGALVKTFLPL